LIKGKSKGISTSAVQKEAEIAYCKLCQTDFIAHKSVPKRHVGSDKHKTNVRKIVQVQKITDVFKTSALEDQVRTAEIKLCGMVTTNNLPFLLMDTLSPLLSNICPDPKIAKHLAVKRTKATAIVNESLGKVFMKNFHDTLKEAGRFF
jgi:hypothetical protein